MGKRKDSQLSLLLFASSCCAGYYMYHWMLDPKQCSFGVLSLVFSIVTLDMLYLRPADSHSVTSLLSQYCAIQKLRSAWLTGTWTWYTTSRNAAKTQEAALQRILQANHLSEHGRNHKLNQYKSRREFISGFPLTEYSHYEEYIEKISNGKQNVLTGDDVVFLATTSGTTGKNKAYPLTPSYMRDAKRVLLEVNCLQKEYFTLRRVHMFRLATVDKFSPCGLRMGGAGIISQYPAPYNLIPPIYLKMYEEKQSYFTQALFMMAEEELGFLMGYSSSLMYTYFKFMEHHWSQLCDVIESGNIGDDIICDGNLRKELESHFRPNPTRAQQLREMMENGIEGVAKRIWPCLESVLLAKTGSFKHCADMLKSSYLNGIEIFYTRHASTEGFMGVCLEKDNRGEVFTFTANASFLEFIDIVDVDSANPKTHFLEELQKDKSYEIVVTSLHGVYRYRLGDVIKVVGFYNDLPKYTFQYRLGERLNIAFDRTPDQMIYRALKSCIARLPKELTLVDYSATESFNIENITGSRETNNSYVIFLELSHPTNKDYVLPSDFSHAVDLELQNVHQPYAMYRNKGNIDKLEVIQIKPNACNALKHELWGAHQNSQFKMPHVVRRGKLIQVLLDHQMKK